MYMHRGHHNTHHFLSLSPVLYISLSFYTTQSPMDMYLLCACTEDTVTRASLSVALHTTQFSMCMYSLCTCTNNRRWTCIFDMRAPRTP